MLEKRDLKIQNQHLKKYTFDNYIKYSITQKKLMYFSIVYVGIHKS